jgi:hypothetical protein
MEEAPQNGKESLHSSYANGMNDLTNGRIHPLSVVLKRVTTPVYCQASVLNLKAFLKAVCCHVYAIQVSHTRICLTLHSTIRRLPRSKEDVEERNDHQMTSQTRLARTASDKRNQVHELKSERIFKYSNFLVFRF